MSRFSTIPTAAARICPTSPWSRRSFFPDRTRAAFYVANRAHHADVGGMYPGSMGPCREIAQEGIRIPPVKLMHAGEMDTQLLSTILANVRTPKEREGDLTAQLGACRIGATRMLELVERFGYMRLLSGVRAMLSGSERLMRNVLASLPAGQWQAEDFLDDDGIIPGPIGIRVKISTDPKRRHAIVDFAGTDPQVPGSINAVYAITWSAVFYVFRCLLPPGAIATAGLMRPVQVVAPVGSIVNARPPAAVAGGNVETSQRIVDTLMRALAPALPDRIPAASSGTMNNLTIGGLDPRTGQPYTYYETIAGGHGASPQSFGRKRPSCPHDQLPQHPRRGARIRLPLPHDPLRSPPQLRRRRKASGRRRDHSRT